MSITVELSELDADLWDAFKHGGEWVAASEYRKLKEQNDKLREELADALVETKCAACEAMLDCYECLHADDSKKERRRLDCENAELRELVKSLYRFSFEEYPDGTELNFADKLCMLGIEVDDA